MGSTKELLVADQYSITRVETLSPEFEIKSREAGDSHWIKMESLGVCMLLDQQREPMGKISCKKLLTTKEHIEINTPDCHVRVVWSPTMSSFRLEGTTDVKGYETIDWKWKRKGWDSKFLLENKADGSVIAEVRRKPYQYKDIGEICIYETLPEDMKWFIVFSGSYVMYKVTLEETARTASV